MNLLEARVRFVELSGRFDLVKNTTDFEDAGANWFIQEACKFLDSKTQISHFSGTREFVLRAGQYYLDFSSVKSVQSIHNADKSVLRKLLKEHFLREYSVVDIVGKTSDEVYNIYTVAGAPRTVNIFKPKPTVFCWFPHRTLSDRSMFVNANFRSDMLYSDGDSNYWTDNMLGTLISAAMYQVEKFYRNTEGAKDYLRAIEEDLRGVEFDDIEQQDAGIIGMGDAY